MRSFVLAAAISSASPFAVLFAQFSPPPAATAPSASPRSATPTDPAPGPSASGQAASASEGKPTVIERAPLTIRPAESFVIPLHLEAARSVDVAARRDGVVGTIMIKLGDQVQAQSEVARLETQECQLELTRAQAAFRAAQEERTSASAPDAAAAGARVDVAKADVDIANLRLEHCNLRTPLSGLVTAVHVSEGQFVRAGEPVITIIDSSKLRVDVPVDSRTVQPGAQLTLKVEDSSVPANVQAVLPLLPRFEPLRDLFLSVATAVAIVENSGGKFRAGQTVYSDLIPRQPVAEVPMASLSNTGTGERKVQVIRDGFVRDIAVQLLGQMGEEYVFVSGRFGPGDELVLKSSERLLDGARVVPQIASQSGSTAPARESRPNGGF